MGRERIGSRWTDPKTGELYARVTWLDESGKRHDIKKKVTSGTKREFNSSIQELLEKAENYDAIKAEEEAAAEAAKKAAEATDDRLTFEQLADDYEKEHAVPAVFDKRTGVKRKGLISYRDIQRKLNTLRKHFGGPVEQITYGDLAAFKRLRLDTPVEVKKRVQRKTKTREAVYKTEHRERQIASVHRELSLLHRLLEIAVENQNLNRNPFKNGPALIDHSVETKKERIATDKERNALLAACVNERDHLRPFLLCAFDTGFRPVEIYRLRVMDVDFKGNSITAVSFKGKKRRERQFDMTKRLAREMKKLCAGKKPEEKLFPFGSVKRSFATAKRIAGLADANFRLYDTRHTAATRLVSRGLSISETGKLLGHSQPSTTWRYIHTDDSTRKRAAELMED